MLKKVRPFIRKMIQPILWKLYRLYARKDRWHRYRGIKTLVKPTVFHPGFLISTHIFVDFLSIKDLNDKQVLEIGTGAGLIALFCRQQGAKVTATDINPMAIASLEQSSKKNQLPINIIHSDLFEQIPQQTFDFILSNPPYFPQTPKNDREKAFFCGPEFEFFQRLFSDAPSFLSSTGAMFMILSDDCDLTQIESIANQNNWTMEEVHKLKKWGEWNMIYRLEVVPKSGLV